MSSRSRAASQRRSATPSLPGAISAASRLATETSFRQHGLVRKAAREEVAGVAQALHADADLVPAALVAPGKLAPLVDQARM